MGHGSSFFGTEDPLGAGEQETASIDKGTVSAREAIKVRISEASGTKSLSEAGFGICPGGARHAGKTGTDTPMIIPDSKHWSSFTICCFCAHI